MIFIFAQLSGLNVQTIIYVDQRLRHEQTENGHIVPPFVSLKAWNVQTVSVCWCINRDTDHYHRYLTSKQLIVLGSTGQNICGLIRLTIYIVNQFKLKLFFVVMFGFPFSFYSCVFLNFLIIFGFFLN